MMETKGEIETVPFTATYRYRWIIPKSCMCNKSIELYSPTFSSHGCNWSMEMNDTIDLETKVKYVSLFLNLKDPSEIKIYYTLNILTQDGKTLYSTPKLETSVFNDEDDSWGESYFLKRSLLKDHKNPIFVDDQLIIECTISVYPNEIEDEQNTTIETSSTELFNFEKFLFSESLSDVQLMVGEEVLYAHKFILAARSDVFAAMFTHEMKESIENKVKIEDFNLEVIKEMLRYIYTQKVDKIETIAEDLLAVAGKYMLNELKSICESNLIESLSYNNYFNQMVIADKYNLCKLKKETVRFIAFNVDDIIAKIKDI